MTLVVGGLTFDAEDPEALAQFWPEATGFPVGSASDEFARLTSDDPGGNFHFIKVPEGKTAKNRLHIDFKVSGDLSGETERLVALGASVAAKHETDDGFKWAVMQDPEGNEFCILEES